MYPREALQAAAQLKEYTLSDKGTYTAADKSVQDAVRIYLIGSDNADDLLLNPGRALRASQPMDEELAVDFMQWLKADDGGQEVVRTHSMNGVILYSTAPRES
jgi:ABC-type tungstate transport system permease subunit